ncbi:MAG: AMMECR1 domain-containing protein [Candidatus Nitrosocaldaceae archaeon]|nr:MAG: AMMECR1 domain-containing protein [Candidatus Nitrosocaldaceae archaeon]
MRRLLTLKDGYKLVKAARTAIEQHLANKEVKIDEEIKRYSQKSGVFVTLNKKASKEELRGCIGYPLPTKPLYQALIDAAISATRDPRFEPVRLEEMEEITIELSILTEPELIKVDDPREYPKKIKVGRDGLLIHWRYGSGLLLPQVAIEYNWDEERFLCETCMKAGAMPDCWLYEDTKVYRFQAIIFKEVEPRGEVIILDHRD